MERSKKIEKKLLASLFVFCFLAIDLAVAKFVICSLSKEDASILGLPCLAVLILTVLCVHGMVICDYISGKKSDELLRQHTAIQGLISAKPQTNNEQYAKAHGVDHD